VRRGRLSGGEGPGRFRPALLFAPKPLLLRAHGGLRRPCRLGRLSLLLALKVRDDQGQFFGLGHAPGLVDLRAKAVADLRAYERQLAVPLVAADAGKHRRGAGGEPAGRRAELFARPPRGAALGCGESKPGLIIRGA